MYFEAGFINVNPPFLHYLLGANYLHASIIRLTMISKIPLFLSIVLLKIKFILQSYVYKYERFQLECYCYFNSKWMKGVIPPYKERNIIILFTNKRR